MTTRAANLPLTALIAVIGAFGLKFIDTTWLGVTNGPAEMMAVRKDVEKLDLRVTQAERRTDGLELGQRTLADSVSEIRISNAQILALQQAANERVDGLSVLVKQALDHLIIVADPKGARK